MLSCSRADFFWSTLWGRGRARRQVIFAPSDADYAVARPIGVAKAMFSNDRCHMRNHTLTAGGTEPSELKVAACA